MSKQMTSLGVSTDYTNNMLLILLFPPTNFTLRFSVLPELLQVWSTFYLRTALARDENIY